MQPDKKQKINDKGDLFALVRTKMRNDIANNCQLMLPGKLQEKSNCFSLFILKNNKKDEAKMNFRKMITRAQNRMKWVVVTLLLLTTFLFFLLKPQSAIHIQSTDTQFADIFEHVSSTTIRSDSLFSLMSFVVDRQNNFVICDYSGRQVLVYDNKGKFVRPLMTKGTGPGEINRPISMTIDKHGKLYIVDNSSRRLSIFDAAGKFESSFIISGGHIVPLTLKVTDKIIMGGYSQHSKKLLHTYSKSGEYLNSFMDIPKMLQNTKLGRSTCYPYFDISGNQIISTQHRLYILDRYNKNGSIISTSQYRPDYYVPLTKDLINETKKKPEQEILSKISTPVFLGCSDELIFVQTEMPVIENTKDDDNYLANKEYMIDVFDSSGKNLFSGIKTRMKLAHISEHNGIFYFKSEINYTTLTYTIKAYKAKQ